ncbi:IS1 family transposase [Pontibacter toksunensis]|uniref:IS1 family transposase n=1 Tax=Pontibacter toksunensis TaxID=1332631 RepID=A0ABW6C402_9BACT
MAAANKKETNHAERFFCNLRQRCARLVRKSLSFSKWLERHLMAIQFFAANYILSYICLIQRGRFGLKVDSKRTTLP